MPCCSASRRCSGLYGLFGGARAVERQDDAHAPGALLRLEAAVEATLATGDSEEGLPLSIRRHPRQQQEFAVPRTAQLEPGSESCKDKVSQNGVHQVGDNTIKKTK